MNSKVNLKQTLPIKITIISLLVLVVVFPVSIETAISETTDTHYWITANPSTPSAVMYGTVGRNWTISFEAIWSYGTKSGEAVDNANMTVTVKKPEGNIVENITQPTNTAGLATFHYSSSTPIVLTFTPTKLVTSDGEEWNSSLVDDGQNSLYGFKSESIKIYWDTFDATLVNTDTETKGKTTVSVNITYLLVPEEGLTLPNSSPQQIFYPKIAHGVNVTINGVKAEETPVAGIYTARFSTWLPTAYVIVGVTQEGWSPAHKGFSFTHNSNLTIWTPAIILWLVSATLLIILYFVLHIKTKGAKVLSRESYPIIGGVLLAITSFISLYWGFVGFDSTIKGFEWAFLEIAGLTSFICGLAGSTLSLRLKKQTIILFAICAPLLANAVVVKSSFDIYQLTIPWPMILLPFVISILSILFIGNSDEQFLS
jgi:hypothetical protein